MNNDIKKTGNDFYVVYKDDEMIKQKYKTRAMVEDSLKAHRRKMLMIDVACYCALALLTTIIVLSVWG